MQKSQDLLESLLKQLSQRRPDIPESVKTLYDRHQSRETRPSFGEVSEALHSVSSLYSRVFIVVDALDEADEYCRARFLPEMFTLQRKYQANIFATSRFIPGIMKRFESASSTSLEIRASKEDIEMYLENQISQSSRLEDWPHLHDEIKASISDAVDGMFLLAQIYLGFVEDKTSPKDIRRAIIQFRRPTPGSSEEQRRQVLDEAYDHAMKRINEQGQDHNRLAIRVLSWVTCAMTPLTTMDLQHALAVEVGATELDKENFPSIEKMVSACAGLVIVDQERNVIRLVHYTTQEYFEQTQERWFPDAETDITRTCVTYLSFDVFVPTESTWEAYQWLQSYPFYRYAACHWGYHACKASTFCHEIIDFATCQAKVQATITILQAFVQIDRGWRDLGGATGLHLVAFFAFREAIDHLAHHFHSLDVLDRNGKTPLIWAIRRGHYGTVKLLLDKGADINRIDKDNETPLQCAVRMQHEYIVKLLLDRGADISEKGVDNWAPVLIAVSYGDEGTVKLLLDRGADIEAFDRYAGATPLEHAAENGSEGIVKLLLDRGANVNPEVRKELPLIQAVRNGHEGIVKLLLDRGADIEVFDRYTGATPLACAAGNGSEGIVKLLIDRGADVNPAWWGAEAPPLVQAIWNGHEGIAKLLLDHGANVEARIRGSTPLFHAVRVHSAGSVRLLLDKGANIEAKDKMDRTPLLSASSESDNGKVIKLLLERGANIEAKDREGRTPLSHAAETSTGDEGFKLLLEGGANIETEDEYGMTPLIHAAGKVMGLHDFEKMLSRSSYSRRRFPFSVTPEANIETEDDNTRLLLLSVRLWTSRRDAVEGRVKLLLEEGADIEKKDENGRTALSHAVSHCFGKGAVRLLLERGANIHTEDKDGRTPLSHAAAQGGSVAEDIETEEKDKTPQSCTASLHASDWEGMVQLLLERGADINTGDKDGRTPLSYAAQEGGKNIAKLLLEGGAKTSTLKIRMAEHLYLMPPNGVGTQQ
ncbi:ankyrin repeat-containing domain protein [Diplogelasinospora grovesii]|uniref:Ankyrin repeat-containing domain protein n=1 Tax=Diplogelasinospora grovesii TaxID=303347 RepID=A0AAN6N962_9PEZI|nr:ankyrin repeat-containing domain protein [Diplogelasinospora grovesii]